MHFIRAQRNGQYRSKSGLSFLLLMGFYAYKKWFHIGFWILLTILDPIIEMESIL